MQGIAGHMSDSARILAGKSTYYHWDPGQNPNFSLQRARFQSGPPSILFLRQHSYNFLCMAGPSHQSNIYIKHITIVGNIQLKPYSS